jgi:hypothetical protein
MTQKIALAIKAGLLWWATSALCTGGFIAACTQAFPT